MKNNQKTVFITGSSSGIGRDIAYRLAKEGFRVFAGIRRKVDKIELESLSKNITGVYIDITSQASVDKAFWFIMRNVDKLDVLINNAGIVSAGPVECLPLQKIKEQFEVNTFGAITVLQKFIPLLSNGKIINISSMAATGIFPYISMYCASKRALDIIFNSFALENKDKIKVVSIKPASIKTPIWNKSVKKAQDTMQDVNETLKSKYKKELIALEKNALNNNKAGIDVSKVTDVVVKVVKAKNPRTSYNVGFASLCAELLSHLPLSMLNFLIKLRLRKL